MLHLPGNLPSAFGLNYSEFPNSCSWVHLSLLVNPFQMFVYSRDRNLKQIRNQRLRQPNRLILKPALHTRPPILSLIGTIELCRVLSGTVY